MLLFYRICGWLVDKSIPPLSSPPHSCRGSDHLQNPHPYPRTRDGFLAADSRVTRRMSMRYARVVVMLASAITPSLPQETAESATNEKAQKTYKEASEYWQRRMTEAALDSFKKADKQDGAHGL